MPNKLSTNGFQKSVFFFRFYLSQPWEEHLPGISFSKNQSKITKFRKTIVTKTFTFKTIVLIKLNVPQGHVFK